MIHLVKGTEASCSCTDSRNGGQAILSKIRDLLAGLKRIRTHVESTGHASSNCKRGEVSNGIHVSFDSIGIGGALYQSQLIRCSGQRMCCVTYLTRRKRLLICFHRIYCTSVSTVFQSNISMYGVQLVNILMFCFYEEQ